MRIYKMTATFGKLEHATLTLEPGLNIITAPNEWGKSTWCAFLVAMLYGLDTRAKTTKNTLADKERYAPWSGSSMAGRIDLNWNGRDITIERRTKRRVPLGEFQAYETESGLPVEELTTGNCGQMLLGVEQSVFCRAGFIKHADLPVTQDEALRRRLNALVTTGDDSGAADRLASDLKTLKNNCRYNRSGLLPQAEARRAELDGKLTELESLTFQTERLVQQLADVKNWISQLQNHRQALAYAKMEADAARVARAQSVMEQAQQEERRIAEICATLEPQEQTRQKVRELTIFREQWNAIQLELREAPSEPARPQMELPFAGMTEEEAHAMVRRDMKLYADITRSKVPLLLLLIGIVGILAAAGLSLLRAYVFALVAGAAGLVALVWGVLERKNTQKQTASLREKYGHGNFKRWGEPLEDFEAQMVSYRAALKYYQDINSDLEVRLMVLRKKRDELCGFQEPEVLMNHWQQALTHWDSFSNAQRDAQMAKTHFENLNAMLRSVEKPAMPDVLTHSEEETLRLLAECASQQQHLQNRLGQYQGRMETLGSRENLAKQRDLVIKRIETLEDTYAALTIAQETLMEARAELQRRFAPRITKKAQTFLSRMTGGRYHSLTMSEDLSLRAGAGEEETLHDALWRSDGTMDQLYLALRLAVAEELTPDAPLVLDDALVRFDDTRMAEAVEILKEMGKEKQILLFTCQGREAKI
ncbi:MAG: AAA family ATPase [Oscillospiraceae bacterium]|nr:AAA family ATPase [Oscillospiraceae bacterium]